MKRISNKLYQHKRKLALSLIGGFCTLEFLSPICHAEAVQNQLLAWGCKVKLDIWKPTPGRDQVEVVALALANEIEAAVDNAGRLYTRKTSTEAWKDCEFFGEAGWLTSSPKAVQASVHFDMVYVVDENGDVWEREESGSFRKLTVPEKMREVKVAEDRIAVLSETGRVYFRGSNGFGQSGLGNIAHTEGDFIQIPESYFYGRVVEVALGGRHSLFRTANGHVYSCGSNDNMQLGLPWTREKVWLANETWMEIVELPAKVQVELLEKQDARRSYYDTKTLELRPRVCLGKMFDGYCRKVVAGENHSAALISKSQRGSPELWTWGSSMRGQLGHRNTTNMAEPGSVTMLMKYDEYDPETNTTRRCGPTAVAAGANHTLVTLKGPVSTMVFGLGDNTDHQISTVRQRKFTQPVWLKKISPMNGLNPQKIFAGGNKSAIFCEKTDHLTADLDT